MQKGNSYNIQENQRKISNNEKEVTFQINNIIFLYEYLDGRNSHYQIKKTTWSTWHDITPKL